MSHSRTPTTREPFGLIAWLNETRIQLPLREVVSRFQVNGDVAIVEIDQVFEQTAREPLDITYTFPLPARAAVYRCELEVNGRTIRAVVMERSEARKVVMEKKAAGMRTALVEMERENLFTLSLGNAAPGDKLTLRFAYLQTLERLGSVLSLRIPFCPGLRYVPGTALLRANRGAGSQDDTDQVPDASRLSPPRIDRSHPDATLLSIEGYAAVDDVEMKTMSSPSHPVILRPEDGRIIVRLADRGQVADADFVLRWEEPPAADAVARCWVTREADTTYALLQLRAPRETAVREDWNQDVYFLIDRSGSMQGAKWSKCAEALQAFVQELGEGDRVWITCFESSFQDFAEAPMPRSALLADRSFQDFESLGTAGGTELLPALKHVLDKVRLHSAERRARVVLITDGQVGNEPAILESLRAHGALPFHCFGIDTAVNDAFLESLAEQQGGRCALLTPADDIAGAVRSLAECLRRPVLTDLRWNDGFSQPSDSAELPDLHAGEVRAITMQSVGAPGVLTLTGSGQNGMEWSRTFDLGAAPEAAAPRLLWARERMKHLATTGRKEDAIRLAIEVNMVCDGASFVAWDESEKVSVATRNVYQPSHHTASVPLCASPAPPAMFYAPSSPSDDIARLVMKTVRKPFIRPLQGPVPPSRDSKPSSPLDSLASQMLQRYLEVNDARLQIWAKAFEAALNAQLPYLSSSMVSALSRLLQCWANGWSLEDRTTSLEELVAKWKSGGEFWRVLQHFVETKLRMRFRRDAQAWLAEAAAECGVILPNPTP